MLESMLICWGYWRHYSGGVDIMKIKPEHLDALSDAMHNTVANSEYLDAWDVCKALGVSRERYRLDVYHYARKELGVINAEMARYMSEANIITALKHALPLD